MNEIMDDLENKRFTDFTQKVKTSLEDKYRNSPEVTKYNDEVDRLNSLKDAFAAIAQSQKAPEPTEV